MQAHLHWSGHLTSMEDHRIPRVLFYGQLEFGKWSSGGQKKRYKDILKSTLKSCAIQVITWEHQSISRSAWRNICHKGVDHFKCGRLTIERQCRQERKTGQCQSLQGPVYTCNVFVVDAVGLHWPIQPSHNTQRFVSMPTKQGDIRQK